jgi:hypothetical protein
MFSEVAPKTISSRDAYMASVPASLGEYAVLVR